MTHIQRIFSFENVVKLVVLTFTASTMYFKLESRIAILEDRSSQIIEIKEDIKEIKSDIKLIYAAGKAR